MKFDSHGLIVQQDGDGGDTFARHNGMRFIRMAVDILKLPFNIIHQAWIFPFPPEHDLQYIGPFDDGSCIRHPDEGPKDKPWNAKINFSRDQLITGILFWGLYNKIHLKKMWKYRWSHSMIEQNGDILWNTYSQWIRAYQRTWLYPLLYITDICIFVDTLIRCGYIPRHKHDYQFPDGTRGSKLLWGPDPDDVGDDMNLFMVQTQALVTYDTFITRWCRKFYEKKRPLSYGNLLLKEPNKMLGSLMWYCRYSPTGPFGNPDFAEACRPICEKYFS